MFIATVEDIEHYWDVGIVIQFVELDEIIVERAAWKDK